MYPEFLKKFCRLYNFFPCPVCKTGDGSGENRICPDCLAKIPFISGEHCTGCGGTLDTALSRCSKCLDSADFIWSDAVTLFEYRDVPRELIHRLKYYHEPQLARPLGVLLAEKLKNADFQADLILPIPLFWMRKLQRTYNQSFLLAKVIGAELGIPVGNQLKRIKGGKHQAARDRRSRLQGAKGVFQVKDAASLKDKKILLVDDVFTTGATLHAAAKELRKAGVRTIYTATVARAQRFM